MGNRENARVDAMTRDRHMENLRDLVSELMKTNPDNKNVRRLSEKTGIDYSEDPIELMSTVLKAINSVCSKVSPRVGNRETSL